MANLRLKYDTTPQEVGKNKTTTCKEQKQITSTSLALHIGLVKTESDFIVRLVETTLGRWTLVVAVISVDAYPFLAVYIPQHKYQVKPHSSS